MTSKFNSNSLSLSTSTIVFLWILFLKKYDNRGTTEAPTDYRGLADQSQAQKKGRLGSASVPSIFACQAPIAARAAVLEGQAGAMGQGKYDLGRIMEDMGQTWTKPDS